MIQLERDAIRTDTKVTTDIEPYQLHCLATGIDGDGKVELECFERISRTKHPDGLAALALEDVRHVLLKMLRESADPRVAYLLVPKLVVKEDKALVLLYEGIGKPLSAMAEATAH